MRALHRVALHTYVDRELFEPNRDLVSTFLHTYSKLQNWRLVEEGEQEPGK